MPVKLGTVAPIGFDDFPVGQWLARLRRLGCTVVQAYRNQGVDISLDAMNRYIEAGGMPCDSLHGVFGEHYDPSAPDEAARQFAVDTFRKEGELVLALGGTLVVVHCSTIRTAGVPADERRLRVGQLKKSIAELGTFGQQIGVTYAFENLPAYHPVGWDVAELSGILADVGAAHTGMCFDTGHALMNGDPVPAIRSAGGQLVYVHLNDNSGLADEHEMPSYGTLDLDGIAQALHDVDYHGTIMLEVFYSLDRLEEVIHNGCPDRLAQMLALANGR